MGFDKDQRPVLQERYLLGEQKTQSRWIDQKPIYRRVVLFTGAANQSTTTVAALANTISTLVTAFYSVNDAGTDFRAGAFSIGAAEAGISGITIAEATGLITIDHQGFTFTEIITLVLEYTKQ